MTIKPFSFVSLTAFALLLLDTSAHAQLESSTKPTTGVYVGWINDNYTGDIERGIEGKYFGPDDFLTFSILTGLTHDRWQLDVVYNMLTSRKYLFRSDLITMTISRAYPYKALTLRPEFGLILRGELGGEDLQNWFHDLRNVPELSMPYLTSDLALILGGTVHTTLMSGGIPGGVLHSTTELRITTGIVPGRFTQVFAYCSDYLLNCIRLELRGGFRTYLNEQAGYSEMLRAGLLGGVLIEGKLFKGLKIRFGITMFPGENYAIKPAMDNRIIYPA